MENPHSLTLETELDLRTRFNFGNMFTIEHCYPWKDLVEIQRIAEHYHFDTRIQGLKLVFTRADPFEHHPLRLALQAHTRKARESKKKPTQH